MHALRPLAVSPSSSVTPSRWPALARLGALGLALVLAACGGGGGDTTTTTPPPAGTSSYTVSVSVDTLGAGESFGFSLGAQSVSVTQAGVAVAFAQSLASGAAYTVSQTSGPRTCTLSANRSGTITAANVQVTATCGAVAGGSPVTGTLRGPVGAQVLLQNNGGTGLTATVVQSAGVTDRYDETAFTFPTPLPDGSAYAVTLAGMPADQTCSVYKGASGTLPVAAGALRVGCERTFDLVSRSGNDSVRGTYYDSQAPAIGGSNTAVGATTLGYGEGRFVAFVSSAAGLAPGSTNAHRQVFWRDNLTGETRLVSATAAGVEGNGDSWAPAISADGLVVVFESYATNLVAGDTNGVRDVFAWSALSPDGVDRISVGAGGVQANSESFEPTVSGDGRVIAFSSGASNLTAGVSGTSTINVYRRDVVAGTNTLITASTGGVGVGGARPVLSEDGNRLAFYSYASNIVAGDTNGLWDVFVYDHAAGTRSRVSLTATGGERNQGNESASRVVAPAISGDGRYVAFATTATNMLGAATDGTQHVYVVDTQTGEVTRASVSTSGVLANADTPLGQGERVALSYDGSWVAFSTAANNLGAGAGSSGISNMVMHHRVTGETRAVTNQTTGSVGPASMSRSASYVAFGASGQLDARFASSGLFSRFTGVGRSWWWID
ncbi:MAG: PD40 domain-containing protein [Rhizobacter sp.]|nr:PD40 domain-containing protein [Rhizobacter sp.]